MRLVYGDLDLTDYPYMIEFGTDVGAPQNVTEAQAFLLQDGEIELTDRTSNRTIQFNVIIEGADMGEMATAEADLIFEANRALNLLTIDPGDFGPASVYETFRAQVSLVRDDDWEINRFRRYSVTVRAYPSVRSADKVTTLALSTSGTTTTTLDAMSATTGWTGFINGASATVVNGSGANSVTQSAAFGVYTVAMQKTFAATTTTTKLLIVDWKPSIFSNGSLVAIGDGVTLPLISEGASPTSGYVRSYFQVAASSLAVTRFEWTSSVAANWLVVPPARTLSVDYVAITDVNPLTGSGRQQIRSLTLEGSTRASVGIAVESATSALGDGTLVYAYPSTNETFGYSPSLRQFRTSGNAVTSDSNRVSGARELLTSPGATFTIPAGLLPAGTYVLLARVAATVGTVNGSFSVTAQTSIGGSPLGSAVTASGSFSLTTTYKTVVLMRLTLPTVDLDPLTPASVQIILEAAGAWSSNVSLDEAWLFNTTIGQLTWVDCGNGAGASGGSARRLYLDPATTETPRPTLRTGHAADRSDSFYPTTVKSWQAPILTPPQENFFTVTPNATDSVLSAEYYPRWHTNAAS